MKLRDLDFRLTPNAVIRYLSGRYEIIWQTHARGWCAFRNGRIIRFDISYLTTLRFTKMCLIAPSTIAQFFVYSTGNDRHRPPCFIVVASMKFIVMSY